MDPAIQYPNQLFKVHIPSIFIGKGDGEILQNYTEGRMKQFGEVTPIQIVIQFDVAQQEKVPLDMQFRST